MNKKTIVFIIGLAASAAGYAAEQRFPVFSTGFGQGSDRESAKENAQADASAKLICGGELENTQTSANCNEIRVGDQSQWSCSASSRGTCILRRDADQTIRILR